MVFKPQRFHEAQPAISDQFPVDATLETAVADALAIAEGLDATTLRVIAKGHEILILGTLSSPAEAERAIEVAMSIPGVAKVSFTASEDRLT